MRAGSVKGHPKYGENSAVDTAMGYVLLFLVQLRAAATITPAWRRYSACIFGDAGTTEKALPPLRRDRSNRGSGASRCESTARQPQASIAREFHSGNRTRFAHGESLQFTGFPRTFVTLFL
jgi:hypothetical protein